MHSKAALVKAKDTCFKKAASGKLGSVEFDAKGRRVPALTSATNVAGTDGGLATSSSSPRFRSHTSAKHRAGSAAATADCSEEDLVLSLSELNALLEDKGLVEKLDQSSIRSDQMLMCFQKIDLLKRHAVHIDDFILGLMRMRQHVQGIDVAASKSAMRRLVRRTTLLKDDSRKMHAFTINVVERLRGLRVASNDEIGKGLSRHVGRFGSAVELRVEKLSSQCERLRAKCQNIRDHQVACRHRMQAIGYVGPIGVDYEIRSLSSASSGGD